MPAKVVLRPFTKTAEKVIAISRVRVSETNSADRRSSGWAIEYLPAGKSRWFWNWRTYRIEHTEHVARLLADVIATDGTVTISGYERTEMEIGASSGTTASGLVASERTRSDR